MTDQDYMRRAISLARQGMGWTSPNPMVGAVIVKNGKIIGEGYHRRCGELHAERNALASLTESAKGATLYVTLEPCCHYGRTPPCTEAILEHGIARVVIGSRDPNPKVAGKGARILKEHGVLVEEDFLREECDALNPVFFHYITTGQPYVVMKYAMTLDGKIACRTGASKWITGEIAREHVHALRGHYAAILAGIGTVLADDPMLNCRLPGAHQPLRIVADSRLRIPLNSQLCRTAREFPTMIVCAEMNEEKAAALKELGVEVLALPDTSSQNFPESAEPAPSGMEAGVSLQNAAPKVDLSALASELGRRQIDSILIEGGSELNEAALRAGIVQHVCAYIAPKLFGGAGAKSPVGGPGVSQPSEAATLYHQKISPLGEDLLLEYDIKEGMKNVYRNY